MKTTNANPPGGQATGAALGRNSPIKATGRGVRVIAPSVDIEPVTVLRFPWAVELDDDEVLTGSEAATIYTNATGGPLGVGDVVVLDGDTVVTTTIAQDTRPVGVVTVAGDDGEPVVVQTVGRVELVTVTAAVSALTFAETSTTAGAAQESVTRREGSFGIFLTPGATPSALLFGAPDAATGTGAFLTNSTGEEPVLSEVADAGATETLDFSSANWFNVTLTDDCTLTFINPPAIAGEWTIILRGEFVVTWPAEVFWKDTDGSPTATPPTMTGEQNVVVITTLNGGVEYGAGLEGDGGSSLTPATTVESETTFGITPAVGTDTEYARQDHTHGTPADPLTAPAILSLVGSHVHVAYETHTSDGATTTFTLDNIYDPGSVMAWNRTTGTMFGVTEVLPDQATLSAAGTAADLIDFHYAASVI